MADNKTEGNSRKQGQKLGKRYSWQLNLYRWVWQQLTGEKRGIPWLFGWISRISIFLE